MHKTNIHGIYNVDADSPVSISDLTRSFIQGGGNSENFKMGGGGLNIEGGGNFQRIIIDHPWSVVAERSSLPDSSYGVSSRMWVRIPAVTLVSLSKTLNHNCFSPPRG